MTKNAEETTTREPERVIAVRDLQRRYGKTDAVNGLNLTVKPGRCYGFFGRNGAGKTTTVKCLLNLLRPSAGSVALFGMDPRQHEVAVLSRLAYVPDTVAFYPWMTAFQWFEYLASFREHWSLRLQGDLMEQFELRHDQAVSTMSKGQKMQIALIGALCPEPELLILDEPTSGLDPLVRREFIRTVIGAYQQDDADRRTVFVSTHLISEFEGLIDEFTIIDQGKELLTMETDVAREQFQKITCRFTKDVPPLDDPTILNVTQEGRTVELITRGATDALMTKLRSHAPEDLAVACLSLEEIFLAALKKRPSTGPANAIPQSRQAA